eukprot:gene31289-37816_t
MDSLANISKIASLGLKALEELSDISDSRPAKRQRVSSELPRNRIAAYQKIMLLKDHEFRSMFRVDKSTFAEIVAALTPFLNKSDDHAKRSKQELIRPEIMLLATLRFLAGGLKHDICLYTDIAFGSFYDVVWRTLEAIDACYDMGLSLEEDELKRQAEEFAAINGASKDQFYGVIMAIDGWVCRTRKPSSKESNGFPMRYRNRKGCFGSSNDIMVWQNSYLYKEVISKGKLPPIYFIIGDEAFTNEEQLLVPYSGRGIGTEKDSFNFHLSVRRQEMATDHNSSSQASQPMYR